MENTYKVSQRFRPSVESALESMAGEGETTSDVIERIVSPKAPDTARMNMSKKRGRGRPKKPRRLKKSAVHGVRLTPHQSAVLATLAEDGESPRATLERMIADVLSWQGIPGLYFTAQEARDEGCEVAHEGYPADTVFLARPSSPGRWWVYEWTGDEQEPLRRAGPEWRTEDLPIHEDEL